MGLPIFSLFKVLIHIREAVDENIKSKIKNIKEIKE